MQRQGDKRTNTNTDTDESRKRKRSRSMCRRCERPTPQACICAALPRYFCSKDDASLIDERIRLQHCHCVVLEHPHEIKHKNRSLPIVKLCLHPQSITTITSRQFPSTSIDDVESNNDHPFKKLDRNIRQSLLDSKKPVWLMYHTDTQQSRGPGEAKYPTSISLSEALTTLRNQQLPHVTVVLIDATWKYAKEMYRRSLQHFPKHMVHVHIDIATDILCLRPESNVDKDQEQHRDASTKTKYEFKPRRFDIRTPPSDQHLSTAESLAITVHSIEAELRRSHPESHTDTGLSMKGNDHNKDVDIYATMMKPLDLMVEQWHSFAKQREISGDKLRVIARTPVT